MPSSAARAIDSTTRARVSTVASLITASGCTLSCAIVMEIMVMVATLTLIRVATVVIRDQILQVLTQRVQMLTAIMVQIISRRGMTITISIIISR